jgi:hypothetical protein
MDSAFRATLRFKTSKMIEKCRKMGRKEQPNKTKPKVKGAQAP